jgi:hypothetical protein
VSVVTNKEDDWFGAKETEKCATCEGHLHYPFLHWLPGFCICGRCVQKIKRGLIADLIHVEAVMALNDLGYPQETFARLQIKDLERRQKAEHRGEDPPPIRPRGNGHATQ